MRAPSKATTPDLQRCLAPVLCVLLLLVGTAACSSDDAEGPNETPWTFGSDAGALDAVALDVSTPDSGQGPWLPQIERGEWRGHDNGCDGTIDYCSWEFTDASTGVVHSGGDDDCDGVPEDCSLRTYDTAGRVTATATDSDCDGIGEDNCSFTIYEGDTTEAWNDRDCDGTPDERVSCTTTLTDGFDRSATDCEGASEPCEVAVGYDHGCDGELDRDCWRYFYDEDGRLVAEGLDDDCDGELDGLCHRHFYDVAGNLTDSSVETDCNGRGLCERTYYLGPNVTMEQTDYLCDRTGDDGPCETIYTNDEGELLRKEVDEECDGIPEKCRSVRRSDGRIEEGTDGDCDGEWDTFCGVREYNDDQLRYSHSDPECDGMLQNCFRTDVDDAGRVLSSGRDPDCDDVLDTNCRTYEYDRHGRPIWYRWDTHCDGEAVGCTWWVYGEGSPE